jgi:mannitol-1-phosphate 5-dehydrogenase
MEKLVLFGAGKIGRSFIGQLFAQSGFEIVFIDLFEPVIHELNRKKEYPVIIKSDQPDEIILVKNVRGILYTDKESIVDEIVDCSIVAISVGQAGLPGVIPVLAQGLLKRRKRRRNQPLDIIIAENMRNADLFVKRALIQLLGPDYPMDELVGLIETSIGKMVPIMACEEQEKDLLQVFAEPYNTLILAKKAFKNPIPEVKGLAPKENIKAWVDRKSYIHNLGHAAAAYHGYQLNPSLKYLHEVLAMKDVEAFTKAVMKQSSLILMQKYPGEFSTSDLDKHIEDLIQRFQNKALGDTVYRVGCDLKRKLHINDRVLSPTIEGHNLKCQIDLILQTFSDGLSFRATGDNGKMFSGDTEFATILETKGIGFVLENICGLHPETEIYDVIISSLNYNKVTSGLLREASFLYFTFW